MTIAIQLAYLLASILFIMGIKLLGKTKDARKGNMLSAIGMLVAIVATLITLDILSFVEIFSCMLIGGAIGLYYAKKVEMTQIPEMVALFNGFGGLASLGVALSDHFLKTAVLAVEIDPVNSISIIASVLIGGVTFTGSMVAWLKLNGKVSGQPITFKGQHVLNLALLISFLVISVFTFLYQSDPMYITILVVMALLVGILIVIPIGGADMPVVISLLNSYSGMAACATGFILNNNVLIVAGSLVGASGLILTQIMCKAMNRSLTNVLLGGFGQTVASGAQDGPSIVIKEIGVEETAMLFDSVSSVIVVPGYGMAVAQAQHVIRELMEQCEKRGIDFKFAIHPVAGRMPGHMNVLLAEANISYDKLIEMEAINDEFPNTDLVLIVGANDVVNPAARTNPQSPIYGMPILNADKAKTVIVSKRSMGKGYAGVENELFGYPNCLMLFGDAKQTITKVVSEMKEM
ncbi:NAD(P)(+) transhydrogenase (Re/Si-specific) subunit beta [Algoriphagus sp.]|uniref:NAD(P)(+) transhydrogenase (Re/Si-specific) subunit beta n=1 Tax=Algoriphagus sp. TaxID=1872435 RepID=UPI0027291ADB|nr:NAD(P)(+) transhydrogenase (Re/Si-specific) subunit beta [Algoriphagus sp.]MDO8968406.1 NAD(P)(+) transhydrogenase (Re/Si-specific) subunit beta [Algoriphagus sp.]MDP3200201.1 NAD(P)(+) transhydrogenase (Re/Si-specific) subunit beta [Algoriphagus sp.]